MSYRNEFAGASLGLVYGDRPELRERRLLPRRDVLELEQPPVTGLELDRDRELGRSRAEGFVGAALAGKTTTWIGVTSLLQNLGCFFGVYAFTYLTNYTGRVKAFAISFVAAMGMTAYTFWNLKQISDIFWMIPLMGFAQL